MSTSAILGQAWRLARQHPWLWLPGLFLVSLASGNVDLALPGTLNAVGGGTLVYSVPEVMGIVFLIGVLAVGSVALWVASAVARGALIVAVDHLADDRPIDLAGALAGGVTYFGRLFLIGLPVAIPALLLTFVAYTGVLGSLSDPAGAASNPLQTVLLPLCGVLVIMSLGLTLVQHFADRAAVLDDRGPLAAIRAGWGELVTHARELRGTIAVWIVLTVAGRLLLALPTTGLLLPVMFSMVAGGGLEMSGLLLMAVALFLTVMLVLLLAVVNVFTSALWTLAYRACRAAPPEAVARPLEKPAPGEPAESEA